MWRGSMCQLYEMRDCIGPCEEICARVGRPLDKRPTRTEVREAQDILHRAEEFGIQDD